MRRSEVRVLSPAPIVLFKLLNLKLNPQQRDSRYTQLSGGRRDQAQLFRASTRSIREYIARLSKELSICVENCVEVHTHRYKTVYRSRTHRALCRLATACPRQRRLYSCGRNKEPLPSERDTDRNNRCIAGATVCAAGTDDADTGQGLSQYGIGDFAIDLASRHSIRFASG